MAGNGNDSLKKTWAGIQLILAEIRGLREDSERRQERWEKQSAEDRRQAAEDRQQAAEDRREFAEVQKGIRRALVVIGRRGGEFVQIQKRQGEQIDRLIDIQEKQGGKLDQLIGFAEKNTVLLEDIRRTLRARQNGKKNGK